MEPVLQKRLPPELGESAARLPGVAPLDPARWLLVDEAFAAQMALRDRLIADRRAAVYRLDPGARGAAAELLEAVLGFLAASPDYRPGAAHVTRPDGVRVAIDRTDPLICAGRLVQEDLCLMQKRGGEYVLSGAVLCFPAQWTLAEKFMGGLERIHGPVAEYDRDMGRRVARMFDAIRAGRPLWRANRLYYDDPTLHAPAPEYHGRPGAGAAARFIRCERQCLWRLPESGAVVFSIHTYVVENPGFSLSGFSLPGR